MGIAELIFVMVMIHNDVGFLSGFLMFIVFEIIFYGGLVPLMMYLFSGELFKSKKQKEKKLETEIEDFSNSLDEYAKEHGLDDYEAPEEHKEEETRDEKIQILTAGLYNQLKEKNYTFIQERNEEVGMGFYKQIEDREMQGLYCLIVGATYQELGKLKYADVYFDVFLDSLTLDSKTIESFEKDGIKDVGVIKMMLLVSELQTLGLSYKMGTEEYEKANNKKSLSPNKKKKGKK